MKLKLTIENEEKKLLIEDHESKYKELKVNYDLLKCDIESINEQLNRKQELCKQLQNSVDSKLNEIDKVNQEKQALVDKCSKLESHIGLLETQVCCEE